MNDDLHKILEERLMSYERELERQSNVYNELMIQARHSNLRRDQADLVFLEKYNKLLAAAMKLNDLVDAARVGHPSDLDEVIAAFDKRLEVN